MLTIVSDKYSPFNYTYHSLRQTSQLTILTIVSDRHIPVNYTYHSLKQTCIPIGYVTYRRGRDGMYGS
jgi:hypothetical protein